MSIDYNMIELWTELRPMQTVQHYWTTTRNIVGPDMLRPFTWNHNNVGTCCVLFETGQTFGATSPNISTVLLPVMRSATMLPRLHPGTTTMLAAWKCLRTRIARITVPECIASLDDANNVGSCCVRLHAPTQQVPTTLNSVLRPFAWAFSLLAENLSSIHFFYQRTFFYKTSW